MAVLGAAMVLVFVCVVMILMWVIPGPLNKKDYLVIGTLATFGALGTLFGVVLLLQRKPSKPGGIG